MQLPNKASVIAARKEFRQQQALKMRRKIMKSKCFADLPTDEKRMQAILRKMDPTTQENYAQMQKNIDMLIKRIQQTISLLTNQSNNNRRTGTRSKEKEISFIEIPKLLNFVPAQPELIPWSHERRNELFSSVFRF